MKKEHKIILICFALICVLGVLLAVYLDNLPKTITRAEFVQNLNNATTIRTKAANSYWKVNISGNFADEELENEEYDLVVNEKGYVAYNIKELGKTQIVAMTEEYFNDILTYLTTDGLKEEYSKKDKTVFAKLSNTVDGEVVEIKFTLDLTQGYLKDYINTKDKIDVKFSLVDASVTRKMFMLKLNDCETTRQANITDYSKVEVYGNYKNSSIAGEIYNLVKLDDKYCIENIKNTGDNLDIEINSATMLQFFKDLGASFKERYIVTDEYMKAELFNVVTTGGVSYNINISFEYDFTTGLLQSYSNSLENLGLMIVYRV